MILSELARTAFQEQLERMQLNLEGCIEGVDPIHLHDLRVANRRTRVALLEFRNLLPDPVFKQYQENFRWIHKITGPVRDLDVGLSNFPVYKKKITKNWRPKLIPARELMEEKRLVAQAELAAVLRSPDVGEIFNSWSSLLEEGVLEGSEVGLESAREYGCRRIIIRFRKTREQALKIGKKTPAKKYHDFRIQVKELRYLLEFFEPVLDLDEISRVRTGLKNVQNALGAYQDAAVQITNLTRLAEGLHQSGSGIDPFLALGQLIGVYEKELRRCKKESRKTIRWLTSDATAREFQSCFKYPVK